MLWSYIFHCNLHFPPFDKISILNYDFKKLAVKVSISVAATMSDDKRGTVAWDAAAAY